MHAPDLEGFAGSLLLTVEHAGQLDHHVDVLVSLAERCETLWLAGGVQDGAERSLAGLQNRSLLARLGVRTQSGDRVAVQPQEGDVCILEVSPLQAAIKIVVFFRAGAIHEHHG